MANFLDFEKIKKTHKIEDVAKQLGLELKPSSGQLRGPCPSGNGGPRAFVITPAKQAFYSFGLNKGGDCLSLVALVRDCTLKEAAAFIAGAEQPKKKKAIDGPQKPKDEKPSEGFRPLDYLVSDHEAVIAIGLDPIDAARIGAGYSPRGVLRGTVAIPVRDTSGKLLGYVGAKDVLLPKQWHH